MRHIITSILFFTCSILSFAIGHEPFYKASDAFFKKNVQNGLVDYDAIEKNPTQLNALIDMIATAEVNISNDKDYQAFYINAYNLYVIKGIVDHKLSSPLDKKGFFDAIKYNVAGEQLTLNDIENKKLRAQFKDPRFHFVLVCGALGCPPLINKAYRPETLEQQLEKQTRIALNNNQFIKIKKNKVAVSQIFEWYEEDFNSDGNDTLSYISKYRKEPLPEKAKLSFYPYNWNVNKQ